jgi:very-short-patch-repair endonuclease
LKELKSSVSQENHRTALFFTVIKPQQDAATLEFIKKARAFHGDRYDYSKVRYQNAQEKVCIVCPVHGDFWQIANSHVRGLGCRICGIARRGREKREAAGNRFIAKARTVHGKKYDYSQTVYFKANHKVMVICPAHGPFMLRPNNHLRGVGCPGCKSEVLREKFATGFENFVRNARAVHGRRYQYRGDYINGRTPITVTCPIHGDSKQRPADHLRGVGCPDCAHIKRNESKAMSHAEFVSRARIVHAGKGFTYPERYSRTDRKISIRCPKHGMFRQTPNNHLHGYGCALCQAEASSRRQRIGHEAFVAKALKVHGRKYRYPDKYQTAVVPITIICPKHGPFRQIPNSHLSGNGCPGCNESSGERAVAQALKSLKIPFTRQKGFPGLRDNKPLRFDFFLHEMRTLIEFDGIQHFQSIELWGGDAAYAQTLRKDRIKTKWAELNGYNLIRIPYTETVIDQFLRATLPTC